MTKAIVSAPKTRKAAEVGSVAVRSASASRKPVAERAKKPRTSSALSLPADLHHRYVAEAAYFIAEQRGFQGRSPDEDWFEAEGQIRNLFAGGVLAH